MDVTAKIARFVFNAKYEQMPPAAVRTAKIAVLDCLGVALAGSKEECAKVCASLARQESAIEEAAVFGQGFKTSTLHAAFINGTAAHALDFDHSFTLMGQPTAPIIPALFSLGESIRASGRQLIEAYVVGFEVAAKLAHSLRAASESGWHGPGSLGGFGAGAACVKLLRLEAPQIEMALGIAASMAGGVVANFGTMTKPLHVGFAARNGVLAAKLAQAGCTANPKGLEAPAGFFEMFYPGIQLDPAAIEELGNSYALVTDGIKIKPYPCGGLTHIAIDSVLEMRAQYNLTADLIDGIDVDVPKHTFDRIVFRVPQTGLQGKFCMNYLLARAILDGKISLDNFTDAAVRDRRVLELAEKVQMRLDPSLKTSDLGGRPCRVMLHLKNGATYVRQAEQAKGSPHFPLTPAELKSKFSECARQALSESAGARAIEYVDQLETLETIKPLSQLLMG
jgi:2-methylcitrate dehydratase PrpD